MNVRDLQEKLSIYDPDENVVIGSGPEGEEFDVKFINHNGRDRIRLDTGVNYEGMDEIRDEIKQLTEAIQKVAELGVGLRVRMDNEQLPMPKEFTFVKELLSAIK